MVPDPGGGRGVELPGGDEAGPDGREDGAGVEVLDVGAEEGGERAGEQRGDVVGHDERDGVYAGLLSVCALDGLEVDGNEVDENEELGVVEEAEEGGGGHVTFRGYAWGNGCRVSHPELVCDEGDEEDGEDD